jgi:uncharacterized protein (TIGR02266 family)
MGTQQYLRANMKWPVMIETTERTIEGVTLNMSTNGAFIRCANPLRLNEVVDISISIPNSDRSLKANVEVVWSNIYGPDDETTPRGMGVRFLNISSEDRQIIAKEVLQHLQEDKEEIDPKKLQTLQTLIIDQNEIGSAAP